MAYLTLEIEQRNSVVTIWLNRPDVRNALNGKMIAELIDAFTLLNEDDKIRVIILRGRGKSFCAGADLNWMRAAANNTYEQNLEESRQLALCFQKVYHCQKPTIALVHGAAMGGANGLIGACDFAFCEHNTTFSLSEVKLGLIPGTISPYVIKKIGEFAAKDLMLTGRKIIGGEAEKLRLVNASVNEFELDNAAQSIVEQLLTSGPLAIRSCKQLINDVVNKLSFEDGFEYTAKSIADARKNTEAQEGMAAFLEKRKPNWIE